jgi:hypothetical protein
MGYHRDTFCEVHRGFQAGGAGALVAERRAPGAEPPQGTRAMTREPGP